jgi:hypothetical protein
LDADAVGMSALVAFVTQYDAELGGTVLATLIVALGGLQLLTGRSPDLRRLRPSTIRAVAAVQILVGLAFGVASFRLDREPDWGGTPQIVALSIWLAVIAVVAVVSVKRYRTPDAGG